MTLIQHISAVRAILANGIASRDISVSDRVIAHFLQVTRAFLLERKADKYRYISDQSFQSACLDLELGSFHNCCNVPDIECNVLKSSIKIPKLLSARWGNFIQVMDLVGNVIPEFNLTNNKYAIHGILKPGLGWFIHDGYLYIVNNKKLEKIVINGLFSDPTEIEQLNCANGSSSNCTDYGSENFPIDEDLIESMYKATLEFLIRGEQMTNDTENNARSTENTGGKQ